MRYIYNFILFLILPFLPIRLLWRSRKNIAYRRHVLERFAYFDFPALKESIWVHAVSVGEALSAVPLIRFLIESYPNTRIVVTTMTPTGRERIQKVFNDKVLQLYVPYDYPFVIKKFLHHINPKILILMETEIWPNILYYSSVFKIPVILGNARLSIKSFSGYKKIRALIKPILNCIAMIMAQSKIDAERFLALGLEPQKISVVGNVKFDITISDEILLKANQLRSILGAERHVWIAASTHKTEEEKVLAAAKKVLEILPNALLILVPRHPERFNIVFDLCNQQGFEVVRYSDMRNYSVSSNIILGDVMGQLLLFYAAGDVAFVGGSLIPWGGHNLIEPAFLAKPILSGPYLDAFLEISQMLIEAQAMIKVEDELELVKKIVELFQNKSLREKLGAAAFCVIEKHKGVTKKIFYQIQLMLAKTS